MSKMVSIFMLVRNNLAYTAQALQSVKKCTQHKNYEIIVVNNASDDGTVEWLKKFETGVSARLITNEENRSFSEGNNQAAAIAKGDYFLLLNNDTIVTPGWMTNLLKVFEEEENVGIAGSKLIRPGMGTLQHCGVLESLMNLPVHQYFNHADNIPEATIRSECFAVTGACFMTPAELYKKYQFDETFFYGWEDIDYANKLKQDGYRIIYEPTSVVYHYESKTPGRYVKDNDNMAYYMRRWVLYNEA